MFLLEGNVRTLLQHNQQLSQRLNIIEYKLNALLRASGIDPNDMLKRLDGVEEAAQRADGEDDKS